jgi:hypothetical protein
VAHAGTRNGAYGPGFFQLDLRVGYRRFVAPGCRLEVFGELFNVTNRPTFDNPSTSVLGHAAADRRLTDFLVLRSLRPNTAPRTAQLGVRLNFG